MYNVGERYVFNEIAFCVLVVLSVYCAMLYIHQDMLVQTSVVHACVYITVQLGHFFFKAVYSMLFLLCKDPCYSDEAKTIGCSSLLR